MYKCMCKKIYGRYFENPPGSCRCHDFHPPSPITTEIKNQANYSQVQVESGRDKFYACGLSFMNKDIFKNNHILAKINLENI